MLHQTKSNEYRFFLSALHWTEYKNHLSVHPRVCPCVRPTFKRHISITVQIKLFSAIFVDFGLCSAWSQWNIFTRALAIVWASVRPSVTLRYCVKTTQARITKSLHCVAAKTIVYRGRILWVRGFLSNRSVKERYRLKFAYFTDVGSYSV